MHCSISLKFTDNILYIVWNEYWLLWGFFLLNFFCSLSAKESEDSYTSQQQILIQECCLK